MKILGKVFSGIACSFLPVVLLGQQVEKSDVITSITHEQETGIPYWQDIQTVSVNREEPRTAFMTYDTREDALTGEYEKSRFYKLLNGVWQFYYSDSHRKLPTDVVDVKADTKGWSEYKFRETGKFKVMGYLSIPIMVMSSRQVTRNPRNYLRIYQQAFTGGSLKC